VGLGREADQGRGEGSFPAGPELWLARPGHGPVCFAFHQRLRPDAAATLDALRRAGLGIMLASGDRAASVAPIAAVLGVENWRAEIGPVDKVALLESLQSEGHRVLMVGDGLNDGPSLASASVSASPATAADISQTVADVVFQGRGLSAVATMLRAATRAQAIMRQNLLLAVCYNAVMLPLAVVGLVTPWLAAGAMSASSLLVMANSFRAGPSERRAP
jgi:P-type Cu2+ transporter